MRPIRNSAQCDRLSSFGLRPNSSVTVGQVFVKVSSPSGALLCHGPGRFPTDSTMQGAPLQLSHFILLGIMHFKEGITKRKLALEEWTLSGAVCGSPAFNC